MFSNLIEINIGKGAKSAVRSFKFVVSDLYRNYKKVLKISSSLRLI